MPRLFKKYGLIKGSRGITLIEILVTASIIVFVSAIMLGRTGNRRASLELAADTLASDIRLVQSLALYSRRFQGTGDSMAKNRCGYGISQSDSDATSYILYAGSPTIKQDGSIDSCGSRNYGGSASYPIYKRVNLPRGFDLITNPGFKDIFFQPPGPTTYINNSSTAASFEQITVKKIGVKKNECNSGSPDCIFVCVYLSGRIEVTKNTSCP